MNLQRRKGGVYYYRRAVPEDVQAILGKREIVRSLRTRELSEARKRAEQFGIELDQEFDQARSRGDLQLSIDEAQRIAERRYRDWLTGDANRRADGDRSADIAEFHPDLLEDLVAEIRCALVASDHAPVAGTALELLREAGLDPDSRSLSFRRLALWLLRYQLQYYKRVDERNAGIWIDQEPVFKGGYVPRPLNFS
jgi:hypothetical protein